MKKILIVVLSVLLLFALVACGDNKQPNETNGGSQTESTNTTDGTKETEPTTGSTEAPVDLNNWGVEDTISTDNGETLDRYSIRVPQYKGTFHMYSKISEQSDNTAVLLSGQHIDGPKVDKVSDVFSTYIDYTIESLKALYGIQSSNYKISVDTSTAVKIGDYDMYVHEGTISYDFDSSQRSHKYVAYATLLQPSGNCAYWMVYDISDNGVNGALIAEHALNMAKTFNDK